MVDVGGDYGAACGHFLTHEFRRDVAPDATGLVVKVLADSHILHFGSDDAFAGIVHLCDAMSFLGTTRLVADGETYGVQAPVVTAHTAVLAGDVIKFLCVVTVEHPIYALAGKALVDVGLDVRIGVGTRRVVDSDIFVGIFHTLAVLYLYCGVLMDLAHAHADVGA